MNSKHTWIWIVVAAVLFGVVYLERRFRAPDPGPVKVLPNLQLQSVTGIQIIPREDRIIRVERTPSGWRMIDPVPYAADSVRIEGLLQKLQNLTAAPVIPGSEVRRNPNAERDYGFSPRQISVVIQQDGLDTTLLIGNRTAPGGQTFVQVVGVPDVYVVDAELLETLPASANTWRDPVIADLQTLAFDNIAVTNAGKVLHLQLNATNNHWRMTFPMSQRADNSIIEHSLEGLRRLRAMDFNDGRTDLDSIGLQNPELTLALRKGTNAALVLEFGRTNNTGQLYARRAGQNTIVTVARELVDPWFASQSRNFRDFLDRHLIALSEMPRSIGVHAGDVFTLERLTNETWRIEPQDFPADAGMVNELILTLAQMETEIVQDVVTDADLPRYGLAEPTRKYILQMSTTNELHFGTNQEDRVFVRSVGEDFVYSVKASDAQRLPSTSWEMRERRIWNFEPADVARIVVQHGERTRVLVHNGTNQWSLGAGSQGIINPFGIEDATAHLGQLAAAVWVERGDQNRSQFGFTPDGHRMAIELKNGTKLNVEFGGEAPSGFPYAMVILDNEPWIFEFPWATHQYALNYLSIPATIH